MTDQKRSSTDAAAAPRSSGADDDFDQTEREAEPVQTERRAKPASARDLLMVHLPERARRENTKLHSYLTGSICFVIPESRESFLFDWTNDVATASDIANAERGAAAPQPDCTITISEANLLRICSGDLNPQVGMLSDKISVVGRLGLAIYVFNLIAPVNQLN